MIATSSLAVPKFVGAPQRAVVGAVQPLNSDGGGGGDDGRPVDSRLAAPLGAGTDADGDGDVAAWSEPADGF
jgi:hypothetical protein